MIKYRKLKGYKYQLLKDDIYLIENSLYLEFNPTTKKLPHINSIKNDFLEFYTQKFNFCIVVKKGYAWDGPSGPTVDTKTFMRGSLFHDALYQLIREKKLSYRQWKPVADKVLQIINKEEGMNNFRAWYTYHAVRFFGCYAL